VFSIAAAACAAIAFSRLTWSGENSCSRAV
jgi:hypothetical protein